MNEHKTETSETAVAPESTYIKRWQISAAVLAGVLGVVLFTDIFSYAFAAFFLLLGIIIILPAFTFPIIIEKYKLLLIPVGIFLLACTIIYTAEYPELILAPIVFLGVIGGFGAVADGFVRWVSAKGKKKVAVCIFIVLLPPVLLVSNSFFGRPVDSFFINRRVQAYVAQHYAGFDLIVGRTGWCFKSDSYFTNIYCRNNDEIFFFISYSDRGIRDDFTSGRFLSGQLRVANLPHMEEHFGDDLRGFNVSVRGLQIGEKPSQSTNLGVMAHIELTIESPTSIAIAEKFIQSQEVLRQSEIPFTEYQIRFFLPDGRQTASVVLHTSHINENLPALIEYMQDNLNEYARYVDRERGTSYRAFLDS